MRPLIISDAETMCLALQDEIRRSDESRYDHRLHGVLLVAQGMSCRRWAAYWATRREACSIGFIGLKRKAWLG